MQYPDFLTKAVKEIEKSKSDSNVTSKYFRRKLEVN